MMKGILHGTMLVVLLTPAAADAQQASDASRAPVTQGDRVRITDESGRSITARVAAISGFGLTLQDGNERTEIPYRAIVKIERPRDRVWDGALAGFGIGAGLGLIGVAAEENNSRSCQPNEWFCGASFGPPASAVVLMLGGIGAGIGAGVDALIGGKKTLYERGRKVHVAPVIGRSGAAARVTVAW
jgi:hypothetical protein